MESNNQKSIQSNPTSHPQNQKGKEDPHKKNYGIRKTICKNNFPYHFKKIIVRYKKIGYNIDVLRTDTYSGLSSVGPIVVKLVDFFCSGISVLLFL